MLMFVSCLEAKQYERSQDRVNAHYYFTRKGRLMTYSILTQIGMNVEVKQIQLTSYF
jgi:hypothetical protein